MRSTRGVRALACYGGAGRRVRIHTALRWWSCPFEMVACEVPEGTDVLDLGCGHGVLSLHLAIERGSRVLSVDVAELKVNAALMAVGSAVDRGWIASDAVQVKLIEVGWVPPAASFDVVTVVDVFYLLNKARRSAVLADVVAALRPGGRILVKETAETPRRKMLISLIQEFLAVRVLRITSGDRVGPVSPSDLADELLACGLTHVTIKAVDRGFAAPHVLVSARRPES